MIEFYRGLFIIKRFSRGSGFVTYYLIRLVLPFLLLSPALKKSEVKSITLGGGITENMGGAFERNFLRAALTYALLTL